MPMTSKGKKIMANLKKEYGAGKGKEVFYAMRNAHKITGVDRGFYGHLGAPKSSGKPVKGGC